MCKSFSYSQAKDSITFPTLFGNIILDSVVMSYSIETSRSSIPVVAKKPKKHSMRRSLLPQEMPTDDYLNVLKRAFQCYCEDNIVRAGHIIACQCNSGCVIGRS